MSLNPYYWLSGPIDWSLRHLTSSFGNVGVLDTIGAFGLAIIVVTLAIRVLLFPLYQWQLKTTRRIQAEQRLIAPQMQALRKKYKNDRQTLQTEIMKLYREHGISPLGQFAGCLPLLIQLPILGGLYTGIRSATGEVHSVGFLWIGNLGQSAKDAAGGSFGDLLSHPALLILPVLSAIATYVQSKISTPPPRPDMTDQERQMYSTQRNLVIMMPAIILLMGVSFYQGIALYWVTQSIVMIIQQFYLLGWGGMNVPEWVPGRDYTPPLSYKATTATTLKALHVKTPTEPLAKPARVGSGRQQLPPAAKKPGGTDPRPAGGRTTPARRTSGRVSPQTAGGARRKRGR